jgi:hypothetical protein
MVNLIADDHDEHVIPSVVLNVIQPHAHILKWIGTGNVIDQEDGMRVPQVSGNETSEPLLAGCIPKLQPDWPVPYADILGDEINANGWLNDKLSTLCVESN